MRHQGSINQRVEHVVTMRLVCGQAKRSSLINNRQDNSHQREEKHDNDNDELITLYSASRLPSTPPPLRCLPLLQLRTPRLERLGRVPASPPPDPPFLLLRMPIRPRSNRFQPHAHPRHFLFLPSVARPVPFLKPRAESVTPRWSVGFHFGFGGGESASWVGGGRRSKFDSRWGCSDSSARVVLQTQR